MKLNYVREVNRFPIINAILTLRIIGVYHSIPGMLSLLDMKVLDQICLHESIKFNVKKAS